MLAQASGAGDNRATNLQIQAIKGVALAKIETADRTKDEAKGGAADRSGYANLPANQRAVERALSDLRRAAPVVIRHGPAAALVLSAEGVTPNGLAYLRAAAGAPPALALTARRAEILGFWSTMPGDAEKTGPAADGVHAVRVDLAGGVKADDVANMVDPLIADMEKLPQPLGLSLIAPGGLEAAIVELMKLSGLLPAAVLAVLSSRRLSYLGEWAAAEDLLLVEADDIFAFRHREARALRRVGEASLPLSIADEGAAKKAQVVAFRPPDGGTEHLAIVIGAPDKAVPVLVRLHSQCFTGDLLGSLRCDCGDQLHGAMAQIEKAGSGVLIYLTQEGRGIGLVNKLRAYSLQDQGFDTIDANRQLGFDADERLYLPAAEILHQLGFTKVRLMTNNPDKVEALVQQGVDVVERVAHSFPDNAHNRQYLATKRDRSGHLI